MTKAKTTGHTRRLAGHLSKFSQKEIDYAFGHARCAYKTAKLTLLVSDRQVDYARILSITPRAVGTAPERNKLRRQLKAIFYEQKMYEGSSDFIVILKKGAISLTFTELLEILVAAFQKYSCAR